MSSPRKPPHMSNRGGAGSICSLEPLYAGQCCCQQNSDLNERIFPSAERRNDVLGKQLHLAHLLVPGHETLIEKPAKPFKIALATEPRQLIDLSFYLIHRAGERVFGPEESLHSPLRLRQHRRRWIFLAILR